MSEVATEKKDEKPEKTSLDKANDIILQLKEMLHYSKTNIEHLTEYWLFMEDEVKREDYEKKVSDLLDTQNSFHEKLTAIIEDLETEAEQIKNTGGDTLKK
jgi:flagellin-specific chaperone FliS